jgi:hypothetical protein
MQLFEDRIGGGSPTKRLAIRVVMCHEVVNALHELFDAGEGATADGFVRNQCEESLNLVEP